MQKLIYVLPLALSALCITSCDETLSEDELNVIDNINDNDKEEGFCAK